jgi:hypothetical protein
MENQTFKLQGCDLIFKGELTKDLGMTTAYQAMHIINKIAKTKMVTIGDYSWSKKEKRFSFLLTEFPVLEHKKVVKILHKIFDCGLLADMGFICNVPDEELFSQTKN